MERLFLRLRAIALALRAELFRQSLLGRFFGFPDLRAFNNVHQAIILFVTCELI